MGTYLMSFDGSHGLLYRQRRPSRPGGTVSPTNEPGVSAAAEVVFVATPGACAGVAAIYHLNANYLSSLV